MHNFSKIILHTLLLVFYVLVLLYCFTLPYFRGESYYYQDYNVRKKLSGSLDTIIIGSSHALRSMKPTIINEKLNISSYNLSSPLMSMYGRYSLLKKEINRNPVKTVYLELSFNALMLDKENLGYEGDLYVLGRFDNIFERGNFFIYGFSCDEYKDVYADTITRTKHSLTEKSVITQYETLGYVPDSRETFPHTIEITKEAFNRYEFDTKIRQESLTYFNKIIELCKEKDIRVVVLVTPITEQIIVGYSNFDKVFSQYIKLAKNYNLEYYDFNLDKKRNSLYDEETSFHDIHHMSDSGAEIFSKRFSEIMELVNEGKDVSSEFYDSYKSFKEDCYNF